MNMILFFSLFSALSLLGGLTTEGMKKLTADRANLPSNLLALVCSLLTGGGGCAVYYRLNSIPFTPDNILCLILMGLACALASMVGFDKVQQTLEQLGRNGHDEHR